MNDRDLMGIRADTLFTFDGRGRMVRSNEPDGPFAPRCFMGRTRLGDILRFGASLPDDAARRIMTIVEGQPLGSNLVVPPALRNAVGAALSRHGPVTEQASGPVFRFPELMTPPRAVVQVTHANREVVRDTFSWLHQELAEWAPCFAVVRDGAAVSVCFSSRIGAQAAEAGVETLPGFRGRGFAGAVTAAWAAAVKASGRVPLYSTGWDNSASRAVARRLGLIMIGTDTTWS